MAGAGDAHHYSRRHCSFRPLLFQGPRAAPFRAKKRCDDTRGRTYPGDQKVGRERQPSGPTGHQGVYFHVRLQCPCQQDTDSGNHKKISYHPGKFLSANLDKASAQNESNRVTLTTADAREVLVIQIAGLIARRIACWIDEGDTVETGQRFGLIRFGSRLEVFLPTDSKIVTQIRQKVKAGETVIGYLS